MDSQYNTGKYINKVQNEPGDFPMSVDLNSNNINLNSGPGCTFFHLKIAVSTFFNAKSTCPLFAPKIEY